MEPTIHDGDTVILYINGEAIDEPYLGEGIPSARAADATAPITVPDGQFYFCGDNRLNSEDSRSGLLCNVDDIVGRVILRYVQDDGIGDISLIKRPYALLPAA